MTDQSQYEKEEKSREQEEKEEEKGGTKRKSTWALVKEGNIPLLLTIKLLTCTCHANTENILVLPRLVIKTIYVSGLDIEYYVTQLILCRRRHMLCIRQLRSVTMFSRGWGIVI